jgi:dipeptidyl aminopeptidase/acylaminoacyl peptidase
MRWIALTSVAGILLASLLASGARADDPPPAPKAPPSPPSVAGAAPIPDPDPWLSVSGASLAGVSRDGSRVVVRLPREGVSQLYRLGANGGWPHRLTFRTDGVDFVSLSPDGTRAIVGWDTDGDEDYGLYLVDVLDPGREKPLRVIPKVQHGDVVWAPEGDRIFFRDNADGAGDFHLRELRLDDGAVRTVLSRPGHWAVVDVAVGGTRLLVEQSRGNDDSSLYRLDTTTGALEDIDPPSAGTAHAISSAMFLGDGAEAVFVSDRDGEWRLPYVVRFADRSIRPLAAIDDGRRAPPREIDEVRATLDGRRVYVVENDGGLGRIAAFDVATGAPATAPTVRDALASGLTVDAQGRLFFTLAHAGEPSAVVRWDPEGSAPTPLTFPDMGGIPADSMPLPPKLVEYPSFDGTKIPAWLYLPRDASAASPPGSPHPIPFVVSYHGGPEGQERPLFNAERAYLLSLGYGLLAPNIRGSTGYGKAWRDADNGKRRMDAVRDARAAADWLVAQHLTDRAHLVAMGGSYGGFMVLALLTEFPDAFAAGVEVVGIANFETFLGRTAPYRRAQREAEYGSLADRELLRSISPIHKVDRITAALLVGHGERDPRVPVGEARQIETALRERGRPVEIRTFPDEGHGFAKRANRRTWYRQVAQFLRDHLAP